MAYMRDKHAIRISGGLHKQKLRNIGYYHGYKGYRYVSDPNNKLQFTDFKQIIAINNFDMNLKALIYPQIMFIETALKNHVLEIILDECKCDNFNTIYSSLLTAYKEHPFVSGKYRQEYKNLLEFRNTIFRILTSAYKNRKMVIMHFYDKEINVPIWAIFETICLGDFGTFISCLKKDIRKKISCDINIIQSCDTNSKLPQIIIYTLKDLRNAVAHNAVIYDTRFKMGEINKSLSTCLELATGIKGINFVNVIDYLILIIFVLKNLNVSKTDLNRFVKKLEEAIENFRKQTPISIYNKILSTETKSKISKLKIYIRE